MKYKYYILSVIIGVLCKIYDDIYDNNLYSFLGIPKEYIPYFNDILKGFFIIGFTIISINYPVFLIIFLLINLISYCNCKHDFESYEFSVFVCPIIMIPFLKSIDFNAYYNYKFYIWLIFSLLVQYIVEEISNRQSNKEYSEYKLTARFISLILLIAMLFIMHVITIPEDVLMIIFFFLGYVFISCITQYVLVNKLIDIQEKDIQEKDIQEKEL